MQDTHISLAHGNGGRFMRELIEDLFARYLSNPYLNVHTDAAQLTLTSPDILFTTDGFTVQPIEFSGGNIGSLAIHGTVNDLAVSGAKPLYLSLNAFIEEGLEIATLERILCSMAKAAKEAGVSIVAGDTKILPRGHGGGVYFATTGIGQVASPIQLGLDRIQSGDKIIVSGTIGDHGTTVMLAREEFGLAGDLVSDSACVLPITEQLLSISGLHFMRDPTRGGLATVMHEIHQQTGHGIRLYQSHIPIQESVQTVCEMLGFDPLFLACEGRVVAIVAEEDAEQALTLLQLTKAGKNARIIGEVDQSASHVILTTELGGERILEELEDDPLPRIC